MAVSPIPAQYGSVTPYLVVKGAAQAIEFYKQALGATEVMRISGPDGAVGHAEIKIGDSIVMLADEHPHMGNLGPKSLGGTPVSLLVYVADVDRQFAEAVKAGATVKRPIQNQFYGDRSGIIEDPYGHLWSIATHIEDVPPDEMSRRAEQMMSQQPN